MEDKKITLEELKHSLSSDIDIMLQEVADAMNNARAGHIIADSEELVRDANAVLRQKVYQKAIDTLVQNQGSFSPEQESDSNKVEE
jgi:hypothetical protein